MRFIEFNALFAYKNVKNVEGVTNIFSLKILTKNVVSCKINYGITFIIKLD